MPIASTRIDRRATNNESTYLSVSLKGACRIRPSQDGFTQLVDIFVKRVHGNRCNNARCCKVSVGEGRRETGRRLPMMNDDELTRQTSTAEVVGRTQNVETDEGEGGADR
jgi:hypothetical protein